ncbi:serine hydrolase [Goodfellowiella coeruleoviolacea]|uniref:Beta-lactamase enzyme family protein n=1 Tax=Goodfellowiella coeruleoviolacea TaxID=334858 RepID=A0AAE3KIZ9_9PSEU|nr:serine hydrolase [Goodfellowiella coeruleoviolacea]MCP2167914.1 Beta-lactamase enzyme family protein [Goodfellowiella coeruleoviolacea]
MTLINSCLVARIFAVGIVTVAVAAPQVRTGHVGTPPVVVSTPPAGTPAASATAVVPEVNRFALPAAEDDDQPSSPDRELAARIARAEDYARNQPGVTGFVVRDRWTGVVWRNADAGTLIRACSVTKLAMVVDLLLRNDSGAVRLTDRDRELMHRMLNYSDNDAATVLWARYGGTGFATRFPDYGLTDMTFSSRHPRTWGWFLTTADDLDRLMDHILTELPAEHRDYLVGEMRSVDVNQRWGVWGAGPAAAPGNKNGWSDANDEGTWIANSVGFVGPEERYTLAVMNRTTTEVGGAEIGKRITTEISRIIFAGLFD